MKEQDKRAVESMCRIGLSLEGVLSSFPAFPREEIEEIYNSIAGTRENTDDASGGISINRS